MADITMCMAQNCTLANQCYRKTAKPSEWQLIFEPEKTGEDCDMFWDVRK